MSSKIVKKLSQKYQNQEAVSSEDLKNDSIVNFQARNKFDIILTDSSEEESELNLDIDNKKSNNKNSNSKRRKRKTLKNQISEKILDEEELLDKFAKENLSEIPNNETKHFGHSIQVKIRLLNEQAELQQMFGSEPNAHVNTRNRGQFSTTKFAIFGKREPNWPIIPSNKFGLTVKIDENNSLNQHNNTGFNKSKVREIWCYLEADETYLDIEHKLHGILHSRQINLQDISQSHPYHANILLYLSSVFINQEDYSLAADCWKRIFHLYQSLIPSEYSLLRTSGKEYNSYCCLDYKYRLNRSLFLALFQWIFHLCHKSCFITSLEYCKVLLGLNIKQDPLAIILLIDDLALRSNQFEFIIDFYTEFNQWKSLDNLPNFSFSIPLCYYYKSIKNPSFLEKANQMLQNSLIKFPGFLLKYLDLCSIQVNSEVSQCGFFMKCYTPESLDVLLNLYFKRSLNLWKNPQVLNWLQNTVLTTVEYINSNKIQCEEICKKLSVFYRRYSLPLAVQRHIALSNHGELLRRELNDHNYLIFDPLPPNNSIGGYDHYSGIYIESNLNNSWWINLYNSLFPSFR